MKLHCSVTSSISFNRTLRPRSHRLRRCPADSSHHACIIFALPVITFGTREVFSFLAAGSSGFLGAGGSATGSGGRPTFVAVAPSGLPTFFKGSKKSVMQLQPVGASFGSAGKAPLLAPLDAICTRTGSVMEKKKKSTSQKQNGRRRPTVYIQYVLDSALNVSFVLTPPPREDGLQTTITL